jgi:DNA-binding NtrC family response regulator
MVVDDETDILRVVKTYLERWGFVVDVFDNPEKALAHFQQNRALYSLVLTDIRMPAMSGLELANHVLRLKPGVKVVLMTAFGLEPADLSTSLPVMKWQDVLRKPFKLAELCNAVKKQLATP